LAGKIDKRKKYPNPEHPLYKNKNEAIAAKERLEDNAKTLDKKIKASKDLLDAKGSVDEQIRKKTANRQEAEQLALLTESSALAIFERSNGYFDFDKGSQESQDYSKSRPRMNAEIHKHNARESIEELEK